MRPICHLIPYISSEFGGPVLALAGMANAVASLGQAVSVHAVLRPGERPPVPLMAEVVLRLHGDPSWGPLRHSAALWQRISGGDCGVIHSHGLWTDVHRFAAAWARRQGVPHLIGPCGMLDRAALGRSRWKKRLAGAWFQSRALRDASCLLANSEQEYRDIRRIGLTNPVALLPNPVAGPDWRWPEVRQAAEGAEGDDGAQGAGLAEAVSFKAAEPQNTFLSPGRKTVLFLGRLHPVKGLERLLAAWGRLDSFHPAWQLVLAGPDEGGYRAVLELQLRSLGCESSVRLIGALDTASKWAALRAADLFVMPSDFENFGLAIAEALLAEKPVISTTGTPWQALAEQGAGWWVEPNVPALAMALAEAMAITPEQRSRMGRRGMMIAQAFAPERVGQQLIGLYRWLQQQGERPEFVRLD